MRTDPSLRLEDPVAPPDHHPSPVPLQRGGHFLRWIVLVLWAAWLRPIGPEGCAQASPPQERRWLLAIETSTSMAARKLGLYEAIRQLFESGFDQRLQPGDSIGVWTFDREVYTGQFPLQTWAPERAVAIVRQLHGFLDTRTFQSVGVVATPLAMAEQIAQRSASFTLILFCTGEQTVAGTPFDGPINEALRDMRRAQRRIRQPVILVLRGEQGQWVDYAIGQPPWPVRIPATPIERQQESATTLTAGSKSPATPQRQTQPHLSSAAEPAPPPSQDRPAQTDVNTRRAEQPVETPQPGPAPSTSSNLGRVAPHQGAAAPQEVAPPQSEDTRTDAKPETPPGRTTADRPTPASTSTTPASTTIAPPQTRPLTPEHPPVVTAQERSRTNKVTASPDPRPEALPSPPPIPGIATSPGSPATASSPSPGAAGVQKQGSTIPTSEPTPGVAPADPTAGRVEPVATKAATRPISSTDTPGQTPATNTTVGTLGTSTSPLVPRRAALLAAGLVCLMGALLGMLWLVQRSRTATGHGSLITHSLDRQPPPPNPDA